MKDFALNICSIKENTLILPTKTREFLIFQAGRKENLLGLHLHLG